MDPLTAFWHLIDFTAPALGLAAMLGLVLWLRAPRRGWDPTWRSMEWLAASGVIVLAAGLVWFGRDGKVATYAALVVVMGSVAWWRART